MPRFDGALARKLEFDEVPAIPPDGGRARAALRLATPAARGRGPEKYRELEHRRRQAQIKARRLLELLEPGLLEEGGRS